MLIIFFYMKGIVHKELVVAGQPVNSAHCFDILRRLNICSLVRQCNNATNQHGGRKDNTIILTNGQLAISTTTGEAHV
jgi:hypothetical protein